MPQCNTRRNGGGGESPKLEMIAISEIKPYEKNPRKNESAVDAVAASIKEFGFRSPVILDKSRTIICGHTRYKAAQKLGLERIPAIVVSDLPAAKVRALRVADNQTSSLAEWAFDLLGEELGSLSELGLDLGSFGFDDDFLTTHLTTMPDYEDEAVDEVPEPPDAAITKPGELIILGDHRLLCGDSSKPVDLDRLLSGQQIHLVNTDPPYNVNVEPRSNNAIAAGLSSFPDAKLKPKQKHQQESDLARHPEKSKPTHKKLRAKDRPLANDFLKPEEFDKLLDAWFGNIARVLIPGRGFYIWGGYLNCKNYPRALDAAGLYFSQAVIWVKHHPVLGRKDFMSDHEWCFYGWREGAAHQFFGPNNARDVWEVKKVNPQNMVHLTEKPVQLAEMAIGYSSKIGENVLDLFGGSGSTLIGCERTKRKAFLMELDPLYCDVIVTRWEQLTGGKAQRTKA